MKYLFLIMLLGITWFSVHHSTRYQAIATSPALTVQSATTTITGMLTHLLSMETAKIFRVEESRDYVK